MNVMLNFITVNISKKETLIFNSTLSYPAYFPILSEQTQAIKKEPKKTSGL